MMKQPATAPTRHRSPTARSSGCRNNFPVSPRGELWPAGLRRESAATKTHRRSPAGHSQATTCRKADGEARSRLARGSDTSSRKLFRHALPMGTNTAKSRRTGEHENPDGNGRGDAYAARTPGAWRRAGNSSSKAFHGYNEHWTNFPGGRQANVSTEPSDGGPGGWHRAAARSAANLRTRPGLGPSSRVGLRMARRPSCCAVGRVWRTLSGKSSTRRFASRPRAGWSIRISSMWRPGKRTTSPQSSAVSFYNTRLFFWPNDPTKLGFTALIGGASKPFRMDRDGRNKTDLTKDSSGFAYGFNHEGITHAS